MNKKIFITILMFSIILLAFCSYSFAVNDAMNNARNAVMSTGNAIGNAVVGAKNAVVDGAKDLGNGTASVANNITNANGDTENDATNTLDTNDGMLDMGNDDYTATRTATNNDNLLGISDNTWTWLILGIVGLAIVGLVWYYGAQYEHRNYNND